MEYGVASASHEADSRGRRTPVTVTGSTECGYALLLETVDDLAQTLPGVFGGVIGEPLVEIEGGPLEWGLMSEGDGHSIEIERRTGLKALEGAGSPSKRSGAYTLKPLRAKSVARS